MRQDLRTDISDKDFKRLMVEEGYEPVNRFADVWEFRISSRLLRMRRNATVGGWLKSAASEKKTRMG